MTHRTLFPFAFAAAILAVPAPGQGQDTPKPEATKTETSAERRGQEGGRGGDREEPATGHGVLLL